MSKFEFRFFDANVGWGFSSSDCSSFQVSYIDNRIITILIIKYMGPIYAHTIIKLKMVNSFYTQQMSKYS